MTSCREMSQLLSQAQDGQISQQDRLALRRHLLSCSDCLTYQAQLQKLREIARSYQVLSKSEAYARHVQLPHQTSQRLQQTLATAIATEHHSNADNLSSVAQTVVPREITLPHEKQVAKTNALLGQETQVFSSTPAAAIQVFLFKQGQFLGSEVYASSQVVIGRDTVCDIQLDDDMVSRRHAIVSMVQNALVIEDQHSSNGVFITGKKIVGSAVINPRDDVVIGRHNLKIKILQTAEPGLVDLSDSTSPAPPNEQTVLFDTGRAQQQLQTMADPHPAAQPDDEPTEVRLPPDAIQATAHDGIVNAQSPNSRRLQTPSPGHRIDKAPASEYTMGASQHASTLVDEATQRSPHLGYDQSPLGIHDEHTSLSAPFDLPPIPAPARADDYNNAGLAFQDNSEVWAPENDTAATSDLKRGPPKPDATSVITDEIPRLEGRLLAPADSDDDDLNDQPAPFSLVENLVHETFADARISQTAKPIVELVCFRDTVVTNVVAVETGQSFFVGRGLKRSEAAHVGIPINHRLLRLTRSGKALLQVQKSFEGRIHRQGSSSSVLEAAQWQNDRGLLTLEPGDMAKLRIGPENYFVRFAYPPALKRQITNKGRATPSMRTERRYTLASFAASGGTHLCVLLALFVASLLSPTQMVTQLQEDRFAQIDVKELELEQPAPEEPAEEPAEAAPEEEITPQKPQKNPPRAKLSHPSGKSPKPGILAALGKIPKVSGAAGSQSLTAAVSNLDAVKVPGGGSSYKVSGLIGKGPTNRVRIGGAGGGVATKGLASILREGGGGPGVLAKMKSGAVRGRLVKTSRGSKPKGSGQLDRAEIQKVVNKGLGQIQFCYEKELLKNQSLAGKVVFEWTIGLNGSVSIVRTATSTLNSVGAVQCMINSIKGWKFPAPKGGTVIVTYPFIFNSMGF